LLAVRGVVGRVQIDGDAAGAAMQPFAMARDDAVRPAPRSCATVPGDPGHFKTRQRGLRGQILTVNGIAAHHSLCTGSHARRAASLGVFISQGPCPSPAASAALPFSVQDLARLPLLAQTGSQRGSQTQPPVGRLEQDRAAIGTALALIKLRNHGRSKISGKSKHSVVVCSVKRRPHFWSQTRTDNGFVPWRGLSCL